jgi:hypothetical protein
MIAFWAWLEPSDIEAYAASLLLPPYLGHLQLAPFTFSSQVPNRDGREPLVLTYVGEGRLEEYPLDPRAHALPMIHLVAPGIVASRVQLPRDDASWFWTDTADAGGTMRIYFAPTAAVLGMPSDRIESGGSYVSVTRGYIRIGRAAVERYLRARLHHLGLDDSTLQVEMGTPCAAVDFRAGAIGGQMLLDEVAIEDLLCFTRLEKILAALGDYAILGIDSVPSDFGGVSPDGITIPLTRREQPETADDDA